MRPLLLRLAGALSAVRRRGEQTLDELNAGLVDGVEEGVADSTAHLEETLHDRRLAEDGGQLDRKQLHRTGRGRGALGNDGHQEAQSRKCGGQVGERSHSPRRMTALACWLQTKRVD